MSVEGCAKCIKILMFAFNFIFWLIGCALLALGLYIRFAPSKIASGSDFAALNDVQAGGAYVLIGVGALIMVIGFLGCCGAIRESQCLLILFSLFLFVIFAVLLGCAIYAFIMLELHSDETEKQLIKSLREDEVAHYNTDSKVMDRLQENLSCCGAHDSSDYDLYNITVPASCGDAIKDQIQRSYGCGPAMMRLYRDNVFIVACAGAVVAVIMIIGMVFAMCLVCAIRRGGQLA